MEKKHLWGAVLVIAGIAAFFAYPHVRWFMFTMDARDEFKALGRFPSQQAMVGLRQKLGTRAKQQGFESLRVGLVLEERSMGPTTFWFLLAELNSGSHDFTHERRIETKLSAGMLDGLSQDGVVIRGRR